MKKIVLRKYNKIIALVLSLLGVGSACTLTGCEYGTPAVEYGTPVATYKVFGKVSSNDNAGIENIKVKMLYDSVLTDEQGNYQIELRDFPGDQEYLVKFIDYDGESNGSYQSIDTTIVFEDPEYTGGDGSWDNGTTSQELDIEMKENS